MPRRFYLHETIDIVGQGQYEYMDAAAAEPVHDMPGLFRLQGTFFVIGASGGRWPQVVNIHDGGPDGWDAWTRNLDRLNLERRAKFYGDWWDDALRYRTGGCDRIGGTVPGCPTREDLEARDLRCTVFVHQVLEVRPGSQLDYLSYCASDGPGTVNARCRLQCPGNSTECCTCCRRHLSRHQGGTSSQLAICSCPLYAWSGILLQTRLRRLQREER